MNKWRFRGLNTPEKERGGSQGMKIISLCSCDKNGIRPWALFW